MSADFARQGVFFTAAASELEENGLFLRSVGSVRQDTASKLVGDRITLPK